MAEGGGGFNHNLWAQQNLGQQSGDDSLKVNEHEIGELLPAGAGQSISTASKIAMAIPGVGWLLQMVFPSNPGKVSMFAGLEIEGKAGAPIVPGNRGAQGGLLAKIATEIVSNRSIPGGSPHGDGGGGGSDGGRFFDNIDAPILSSATGGQHFESMHVPESMLGTLSSPSFGDRGAGRSAGMDIG